MDDCTHWALNDPQVHTPHLDRLRARGVQFTHAHNQGSTMGAVCLPAREMLLSGRHLFHVRGHLPDTPRLAQVMGTAGLRSCFVGKWHNEEALLDDYDVVGPHHLGGMFESSGTAEAGTDPYHRPAPGNHWDPTDTSLGGHWLTREDGTVEHSSQRWADAAVGFLHEHAAGGGTEPFFLHVAFHAPHDPRQAPAEYVDAYDPSSVIVPPNCWGEHPFDNGSLGIRDELLAPFPRTAAAVQLHRREYFAILSHADAQIGRILDTLDELALTDDTIVVFSGDHGLALGEHGLLGKQSCYDHSIRVPLVVAGPGVPQGETRDDLVYSGSILATLGEFVGAEVPDSVEFPSLAGIVRGSAVGMPELYGAYGLGEQSQRWLRTATHKVISYPTRDRVQLFCLADDPWEMVDLADDPAAASVRDELLDRLAAAQVRYGDPLSPR